MNHAPHQPPALSSVPAVSPGWPRGGRPQGPSGLRWFLIALLIAGCDGDAPRNSIALESRLFSHITVIGSRGTAPGHFTKPRSLVCDREDNVYVADMTGRIQKFSPSGEFLLQWQMPQTDLGKPKGLCVDREGHVVVLEPHYQRVNHFKPDGSLSYQWGRKGTNAGEFILPRAVAQNSAGEFYLSEYTLMERVQRFAPGQLPNLRGNDSATAFGSLTTWGKPGINPSEFNRAEGLCVGPEDAVYVADSCNHRIQIFDRDGKFLRQHGKPGSNPGTFSYPYDIKVDSKGLQFVCEFGNSRVSILDSRDQLIETLGREGREVGDFFNPWSLCLDSAGNLYVADSQNHRVQKFHRKTGATAASSRSPNALP